MGGGRTNRRQANSVESWRERERYRESRAGGVPRQQQVRVKGRGHPHVGHEAGPDLKRQDGGRHRTRLRSRAVIRTRDACPSSNTPLLPSFFARWAEGVDASD